MKHADLFTKVQVSNEHFSFDFTSKIGLVGSCFSQAIHQRFRRFGFNAWSSPFGTLYNPLSILKEINSLIQLELPLTYGKHGDYFFAWESAHTLISKDLIELEQTLNGLRMEHHLRLKETDVLFITVGSAWAYFLLPDNSLVANCHKVPGNQFNKRLLSHEEMSIAFKAFYEALLVFNPSIQIVLTVSPVRHIREGLVENNRSKARLIEWTHSMVEHYSNVHYFPSYEIIMDELRDYRFFEPDGVHPSVQAVDFVWDRVVACFLSPKAHALFDSIEAVRKMEEHRWINEADRADAQQLIAQKKQALEGFGIVW